MSKISTYPILSTPTLNDLLIGTDVENLNETKNFSLSSIGNLIGQNYVPYVGATGNVDLGIYSIEGSAFIVNGGTASQFLKADGTLDSTFYVPQTRTITINSVGYDLSANRSWDLPTIDSLTTLGTSGAATYIGKVLNIPIYQAQGNYITQLSGEATALGPGNATVTLSNSAVISKVLTGLNITGGNVIATDTILQAFGKVQNQINGLTGGVTYQGTWNAATNTPFLQSSVGTKGYYYVVSVPGTTNLNGITDWQLGDWAIYNGTAWEKVDNTDAVVSVNGYTGAVMLTYSDVGAPPATRTLTINGVGYDLSLDRSWTVGNVRTDQTYADPSWITSLGWSKIINTPTTLAGYGITDGVSTARTLTINGVGYDLTADRTWSVGTVTSVGTTAPLTGGTITGSGTIGITQASAISDGYLSSTDWSTFNSKQDAITASAPLSLVAGTLSITQAGVSSDGYLSSTDWNTFNSKVGGSGTANYLPIWTSSSVLGNSSLSFSLDTLTVGYNSVTGGAVSFTNIGLTPYTYSIQMNNFGSPRSTFHNYTDGIIVQAIASTQVSRMFDNGNFILGTGTTDTGNKLTISGDLYVNTITNAIVDTDRFIVSDGGVIKYRTGAQILTDIGAVSSVGLTMPSAFTVSNSPITSSGTIAVTGAGTAAQYIRGDGTLGDFPGGGGGGGASVSYYLNGSVNQGTFGGNTYYEMNKTPILGAGTDFSTSVNGYIAQFITDVGDPDALLIPGGNWNFETYFSASSGGGSPTFYIELYKYDGTTFTLIASNSTNPELIAFGTTVNPYFSALAIPETVLLATDRLAVRIYVSTSGRTITLHTENSNLCQVITTFTTGLTALNGLTKQVQYFTVGTSGTDFNISSSVATHTFNLPTASAVNRGALSSSDWSTFNGKQNALTLTTTGSSGASTLVGATLNVPNYTLSGLGGVPTNRQLTINGTAYDLSADRTWSVGTVTSVAALTLGTSGTDLSSSVANGTTTPVITLNVPTASATNRGALSAADWTTFNNKQNALTNPITGTGTTNYLPKFTGSTTVGNSQVFDDGTNVGINRNNPTRTLDILGASGVGTVLKLEGASGTTTYLQLAYNGATNSQSGYIGYNSSSQMQFFTNDTLRATITSGGNVGIGTSSPSAVLEVQGGNGNQLDLDNTGQQFTQLNFRHNGTQRSAIWIDNTNSLFEHYVVSGYGQTFYTNATERMRITSGGNVGIGTTAPGFILDVHTNNSVYNTRFYQPSSSTSAYNSLLITGAMTSAIGYMGIGGSATGNTSFRDTFVIGTQSNHPLVFNTNDSERMRINSGGDVLVGLTSGGRFSLRDAGGNDTHFGLGGTYDNYITAGSSGVTIFRNSTTERMRITSGGNVGIGTSSPTNGLLVINSTASNGVRFALESSGTMNGVVAIGNNAISGLSTTDMALWTRGVMAFETGASGEKMRITSAGNVGIGTTNPQIAGGGYTGLHINGNGSSLVFSTLGSNLTYLYTLGTGGVDFAIENSGAQIFRPGGNERARITSGGNLLIGTTTDAGFKLQVNASSTSDGIVVRKDGSNKVVLNGDGVVLWGPSANTGVLTWDTGLARINAQSTNDLDFTTSGGGRIILKSAGNVGIGTSSPSVLLHLNTTDTVNNIFRISNGTQQLNLGVNNSGGGSFIFESAAQALRFGTSDSERARITSGGNVLIGTSTDVGARLYVDGAFRTGTLTAGTQTAAVDWRLGNARGGAATANALVRVQINGVLVDLIGNYV
jgi:predicted heme/steroid binding protein